MLCLKDFLKASTNSLVLMNRNDQFNQILVEFIGDVKHLNVSLVEGYPSGAGEQGGPLKVR